ncbi:diguanylate cyclase domain-containing protein [Ideonella sp.]|uniref:GGDEF domain-containing protein n=1 Tax=Ideonella sp. TaxID=1929293 RepID=UPI0035B077D7
MIDSESLPPLRPAALPRWRARHLVWAAVAGAAAGAAVTLLLVLDVGGTLGPEAERRIGWLRDAAVICLLAVGALLLWLVHRQRGQIDASEQLYRSTLDAMEAGIVLYDADDRLVLCNEDFRTLYRPLADAMTPGKTFEALLRHAVSRGLVPEAAGREDEWIAERVQQHRHPGPPVLREFAGGQWRRIVERRLPSGGVLAFSTDVTELVQRESELRRIVRERDAFAEALSAANRQLTDLSETDGLTGIANRRRFDRRLREEWQRAQRHGVPMALLLADVDHFKAYNDHYGHPAGDDCLRRVATLLQGCAQRSSDLVARVGGEEFAVLLPHTGAAEAEEVASRCLQALRRQALPHAASPTAAHLTLSIGVARLAGPGDTPDELVARADRALYEAKRGGRDGVVVASAFSP